MCVYRREKMKWSVMNVRARVIGFGVICVSVFAVMTMGIASCSDSVENEVSQEDSAVQNESPTNNFPGANESFQGVFYAVELRPQGSSGKLKVVQENKCKKHKHEGCLLFEKGKVGIIRFFLSGSEDEMKDCNNEGTDEVITQIELSTTVMSVDPNNTKKDKGDFTAVVADWLKEGAFFDVLDTGIVYKVSSIEDAKTQVELINWNNNKGEKQFWYQVTVTSCDGEETTWVTDPRGDNEGRN
jgi:hypothetical protein